MQKLDIISQISQHIGKIYITNAVYNETMEIGFERGKIFAEKLNIHLNNGDIVKINNRGLIPTNLGLGEAETIAETNYERDNKEEVICITEDKKAKREAIKLNIDVLGVDFLLLQLCVLDVISENQFDQKIKELDKFHKLDLIRITELRRFLNFFKKNKGR